MNDFHVLKSVKLPLMRDQALVVLEPLKPVKTSTNFAFSSMKIVDELLTYSMSFPSWSTMLFVLEEDCRIRRYTLPPDQKNTCVQNKESSPKWSILFPVKSSLGTSQGVSSTRQLWRWCWSFFWYQRAHTLRNGRCKTGSGRRIITTSSENLCYSYL